MASKKINRKRISKSRPEHLCYGALEPRKMMSANSSDGTQELADLLSAAEFLGTADISSLASPEQALATKTANRANGTGLSLRGTDLWTNDYVNWTDVEDFHVDANDSLYVLHTNGWFGRQDSTSSRWQVLGTEVSKFEMRGDTPFYLQGSDLWVENYVNWNGTRDFAFDANDKLYFLAENGWFGHQTDSGWEVLGSDVEAFTYSQNGDVHRLRSNGNFDRQSEAGWDTLAQDIATVESTPGGIHVVSNSDTLRLPGTSNDDVFAVVDFGDENIFVTTDRGDFSVESVEKISVAAGAGDDTVVNSTDVIFEVFGGSGDDTIAGGRGQDLLYGEEGNDILIGGDQLDVIRGGNGNDKIIQESPRTADPEWQTIEIYKDGYRRVGHSDVTTSPIDPKAINGDFDNLVIGDFNGVNEWYSFVGQNLNVVSQLGIA